MHPVLFKIGGCEVISYGVALGLSFMAVLILSMLRAKKEGTEPYLVFDAFLWIFIGVLIGAKLFGLIQNIVKLMNDPFNLFRFNRGGYSSLGGLIGGGIVLFIFLRRKNTPFLKFTDLISPYLALGFAIQKSFGCLTSGCCYGKPTSLPWGIVINDTRTPIPAGYLGVPLHPSQVYDALLGVFLFFALVIYRGKIEPLNGKQGARTFVFLLLFSGGRFFTEFFRGYSSKMLGPVSIVQIEFASLFLVSLILYLWKFRRT